MTQPKFKDHLAWQQAQLLMQPIFIRVIDNIRKSLETSPWQGDYTEIQEPFPRYELTLTRQDETVQFDIWELCYQVCFLNFQAQVQQVQTHLAQTNGTQVEAIDYVEIDTRLLQDTGEVDWLEIEDKTKTVIQNLFNNLP